MSYLELAKRIQAGLEPTADPVVEGEKETAAPVQPQRPRAWLRIISVEISSTVLQADIWLVFDDAFDPQDGKAVFYADELEFLRTKIPEQLREIYKVKLAFGPGSRVRQ